MEKRLKKVHLSDQGVIRLAGKDAVALLQGLITNDMEKVTTTRAIYAALLTPQGKFSQDLFISMHEKTFYIEVRKDCLLELVKKLKMYRLRSDVEIEDVSEKYRVWALWGASLEEFDLSDDGGACKAYETGILYRDPRLLKLGCRVVLPEGFVLDSQEMTREDYETMRLSLGIPNAPIDMIPDKSIPLECNLEYLNAISWTKGCYLGQELTARTKHRGLIRKRLLKVSIEGGSILPETALYKDTQEMGVMRSSHHSLGLALIRLEALQEGRAVLYTEDKAASVKVAVPEWLKIEEGDF